MNLYPHNFKFNIIYPAVADGGTRPYLSTRKLRNGALYLQPLQQPYRAFLDLGPGPFLQIRDLLVEVFLSLLHDVNALLHLRGRNT